LFLLPRKDSNNGRKPHQTQKTPFFAADIPQQITVAEELHITQTSSRGAVYAELLPQIESLVAGETDAVANTANVMAALRQAFGFFWVGVYLVKNNELVLGPFQGPIACTRIAHSKGVCGASWAQNKTIIVPDVDAFPGHIACSSLSKSEIVVPIRNAQQKVIGVIDVDSEELNHFSETDQLWLEKIAELIASFAW
jgi:GAF domain-containing protein